MISNEKKTRPILVNNILHSGGDETTILKRIQWNESEVLDARDPPGLRGGPMNMGRDSNRYYYAFLYIYVCI